MIEYLQDQIELKGIETLRSFNDMSNSIVFHLILEQAFLDDLRVVYSKIIRKLDKIMIRDKEAKKLVENRDYELIKLIIGK